MLKIGEFSELSSITIPMLRNYDKIGLLIPKYVDAMNGYRYYDKEQLVQANHILALKTMGFGLDEIKVLLEKQSEEVDYFLQEKLQAKNREIEYMKDQIRQIKGVLNTQKNCENYALTIVRKTVKSMWVVSLTGQIDAYSKEGSLWARLSEACKANHISILATSPAMAIYHGIDDQTGLICVEVQLPLPKEHKLLNSVRNMDPLRDIDPLKDPNPLRVINLPKREVVTIIFKGSYSQIGTINTVVAEWLEENSLEINGQNFSIYHNSPGNSADNKTFITELCFPVQEKSK